MVPILEREGHLFVAPQETGGEGTIVEYAVAMHRLPTAGMLDQRLADGVVSIEDIHEIALRLIDFHREASTHQATKYGSSAAVWKSVSDDLHQSEEFSGDTLRPQDLRAIDDFYRRFYEEHRQLFEHRCRSGRVVEGHGDLRAEHICRTDHLDIYDCVEFSERLRTVDVASEIAFLAMDLEFLDAPDLAHALITSYAAESADKDLTTLIPFYICYRACVRGKVDSLKSREDKVPADERRAAHLRARRYFRLAARTARGPAPPALILVLGPSGTGKTTVARFTAADTGFQLRRSDVIRKRLAGIPATQHKAAAPGQGLYTPESSRSTYAALQDEAATILREGKGVIIEATCLLPEHREPFVSLAHNAGVPLLVIECRADDNEIRRRLAARTTDEREASDANWEISLAQQDHYQPPDEIPDRMRLTVASNVDLDALPEDLLEHLRENRTQC